MLEKNPENFAALTYLWVVLLAIFGGVVSYLKKLKAGRKWKITDFLIEIITAAFAGLITFFACQSIGIDQMGTAALTGISGHFSSKAISLFGKALDRLAGRLGL